MRRPQASFREPHPAVVDASPTTRSSQAWFRRLALASCACVFLAFSGAFGSGAAPWPMRLAFWAITVGAGSVIGNALGHLFEWMSVLERTPWRTGAVMTLAVAAPLTGVAFAASDLMFAHGRLGASDLPGFAGPALVITAALVALNLSLGRRPTFTHAEAPPPANAPPEPAPAVRFLARLPPKLRGAQLHAVEAQDHYLRLHTSRGSDLILLRLADAVAELEGIEGAQTHRSWWVARDAVVTARRRDGRHVLELEAGIEAPVSRTFAGALRAAGWL